MADDSEKLIIPLDNCFTNTPRSCKFYDTKCLTFDEQMELNELKLNLMRGNETYLAEHQEVRAIVAMILRHVLKEKPRQYIWDTVVGYFKRPKEDIRLDIESYLETNNRMPKPFSGSVNDEELGEYLSFDDKKSEVASVSTMNFVQIPSLDTINYIRGILYSAISKFPSDTCSMKSVSDVSIFNKLSRLKSTLMKEEVHGVHSPTMQEIMEIQKLLEDTSVESSCSSVMDMQFIADIVR